MTIEEKKEIAKRIYKELGFATEKFQIDKIEEINADIFLPVDNQRGIGGVIIGDDGSSLVCGSIYPISHYIEEFKNGKKDKVVNDKTITKDEYHNLFEKDDNDAFVKLIIPANEPTNDYPTELNLIGKLPQDFTTDEVIRMKKYSQKMYEKINNKSDNFDYKLQIIESSWSGWTKNYIPEEKINKYDIKLNKKYSINNGHLEFEVIEIYDDNIVIKTTKSFSDSKEAVNLNSKKTEFTIYSNEETKLTTPTMDAGEIYSLKLVKEDN